MNKFIKLLLIAAVVSMPSLAQADSPTYETYTNKSEKAGKQSNPVRVVKLVRFSATEQAVATISAGEVVVYDTNSDDGVSIRRTTTSGDGAIAGIACTRIPSADAGATADSLDLGRRNWGWIVVHGPATANTVQNGGNGASIGDAFITSTDAGAITTFATQDNGVGGTSLTRKVANASGGFWMDAASASSTNQHDVFVELE